MIVYAAREQAVSTRKLLDQILHADPLERLIRLGQLEAGVVDAICSTVDDYHPLAAKLREIALDNARVELLNSLELPAEVTIRPPEGFAFYSLYPLQYERAARRFARERRPASCVVLGIRSIGTSLSAVVASTLRDCGCRVWSWTVRPRGHPFDRKLELSDRLAEQLRQRSGHWFCIVDEGPGLSGSSLTSVADALSGLGVPDSRIALFPSHQPDLAALVSERARNRWCRHPAYVEPFPQEALIPKGARDVSGGLWREVTGCPAPVQPQHERRKYLHEGRLWKFAGLAHLGRTRFERGRILSDAGFIPRVLEFHNGFIVSEFVRGGQTPPSDLLDSMARYLAFLRSEFATSQPVRYTEIREMIRVNTGIECLERDPLIEDGTVVALDGRMLPYEWTGTLKTDSLDHYDDHFFPGCQDIAWDIAGAAIEFAVPDDAIVDRYLALQQDTTLRRRLPFYRTAYLAYRIGYTGMAAQSLGESPDGLKFTTLKQRYSALLAGQAASSTPSYHI
jgi:hypothetical protein